MTGHGLVTVDARDGDDPSRASAHQRHRRLHRRDERLHRDREGALDVVRLLVEHRPERRRRRVGHEDVEATEGLADPLDDGADGVRLSQIEGQGDGAPTEALDVLGRLVRGGGVAGVGDRTIGAGSREGERDGASHAPGAAGHDGNTPGEPVQRPNFRKSTGRFSTNAFRRSIASSVW